MAKSVEWKTALVYIGTLLGAGFASGQELHLFFGVFGVWGIAGAAVAGIGLGVGGALVAHRAIQTRAASFSQLMATLSPVGAQLFSVALSMFLLAGFAIMLSAGGSLAAQQVHLGRAYGIFGMAAAAAICCWWRTEGFVRVSSVLVPILLALLLVISLASLAANRQVPAAASSFSSAYAGCNWWWSACLYIGYNLLGGSAVLPPLSIMGSKTIPGAFLGGLVLGILAVICVLALQAGPETGDIPFLAASHVLGRHWSWVYSMAFALACLTTAAANLYALAQSPRHYHLRILVTLILTIPLSFMPFPRLVGNLYPWFGYVGLLMAAALAMPVRRGPFH